MIAKNKKGKSFGGCVRYVLNEGHEIVEAEGVLVVDAASIIRDFAVQRSGRPEIKQPVGHIPIGFSPEDAPQMTDKFMVQLAHEYMEEMGIRNTQFIIVRHHDTGHPHIHIVYNRIDNDLKVISVNNDYKRNIKACKRLKDKYGLTYGKGKEKVNRPKLTGADKVKYQIHDEITANLPQCHSYADFEKRLRQAGITIRYKYRSGAKELPENIQGISFEKNDIAFKGSEIGRKFSHVNLKKVLAKNMDELMAHIFNRPDPKKREPKTVVSAPQIQEQKDVAKPEPERERTAILNVAVQNTIRPKPSQQPRQQSPPSVPVQPALERPIATQKPPEQPHPAKRNPAIAGVELTDEQVKAVQNYEHIYMNNIGLKDRPPFSAYAAVTDDFRRAFFSNEPPDKFVKYGEFEMREMDKRMIEAGCITRAKVKWYGIGTYAYPYLWKEKTDDKEYRQSWTDPRVPEHIHKQRMEEFEKHLTQNIPKKNNGPKLR